MFRALAVLRLVVLLNTIGIYVLRFRSYPHAEIGWVVIVVLIGWTGYVTWAYAAEERRRHWVLIVDLALTCAAILVTPYVKGEGLNATVPGFWVSAVVLAWAVRWRMWAGIFAGVLVAICDISIRHSFTQTTYGNIFLLIVGGAMVGFLSGMMQEMASARDRAERAAATGAERQRLARVVHDGVLQVLALVQRHGPELGPRGVELSTLAREQEAQLRSLVQQDARTSADLLGERDLGVDLAALESAHVHVALPGTPVLLRASVAAELLAVVEACLSNVRHHVGREAEAWILLEDLGESWAVSVRDAGPGIPAGRLAAAAAEGRLGVSESIVGRLHDLDGTANLTSQPGQGTEWELVVPKDRPAAQR